MSGWFSCRRQHKTVLFLFSCSDLLRSKRACSSKGRDVALYLQRTIGESKSSVDPEARCSADCLCIIVIRQRIGAQAIGAALRNRRVHLLPSVSRFPYGLEPSANG